MIDASATRPTPWEARPRNARRLMLDWNCSGLHLIKLQISTSKLHRNSKLQTAQAPVRPGHLSARACGFEGYFRQRQPCAPPDQKDAALGVFQVLRLSISSWPPMALPPTTPLKQALVL